MDEFSSEPDNDSEPPRTAQVFVSVGIKELVWAAPHRAWLGNFEIAENELNDLRRSTEEITRSVPPDLGLPPFEIKETRGQTSWGADSGEVIRVVLWIGETAATAAIGAATLSLLRKLARLDRHRYDGPKMTRDEAVSRSQWVVTSQYRVAAAGALDTLPNADATLPSIRETYDVDNGSWTVTLLDEDGTTYTVRLGHIDGLPTVYEISRSDNRNR